MTIHRGLSELKTLDDRIEKAISTGLFVSVAQVGRKINGQFNEDEFGKIAQSDFDSINALIDRQKVIKQAIVMSNATTKLTVGTKTMTVASAITEKSRLGWKKSLLQQMTNQLNWAKGTANKNNELVAQNAQKIAEAMLGKDNVKVSKEDYENVTKPFLSNNEFHLVDPLNIHDKIKALSDEISEFEMNVDAALSESNAITFIEVD